MIRSPARQPPWRTIGGAITRRPMNAQDHGEAKAPGQFTLVEALRGLAAMWVVLFHCSEGHHVEALRLAVPPALWTAVFDQGRYGVAIFFALSGFVIAHSLRDATPTGGFLGRFVLRRALRLDPPYWLSIAVVLAVGLVSARVGGRAYPLPSAAGIATHLFYLQVLLDVPEINPVYWTLTYEVQFYLVLAAVLTAARAGAARRRWALPGAWAAMFALAVAAALGLVATARGVFVGLWPAFFIGVLAYHAPRDRRAATALLVLATAMLWSPRDGGGFSRYAAVTALVLAGALATGRAATALDWRPLRFLGTISYSLYLLHNTITGATGFVLHRALGSGIAADGVTLAAIVTASIAGAWLYWRLVERTAHRFSRRVKLPRRMPRPAPA